MFNKNITPYDAKNEFEQEARHLINELEAVLQGLNIPYAMVFQTQFDGNVPTQTVAMDVRSERTHEIMSATAGLCNNPTLVWQLSQLGAVVADAKKPE